MSKFSKKIWIVFVDSHRSTQIDLSARGCLALKEIGLLSAVLANAIPTIGRIIGFPNQDQWKILHGFNPDQVIYNVSRMSLYQIMLAAVKKQHNITIHFCHQLYDIDREKKILVFLQKKNHTFLEKHAPKVLGCDGANSIIRKILNSNDYANNHYSHQYKELIIPAIYARSKYCLEFMYRWIGNSFSFLNHPKLSGDFDGTLILPAEGANSFARLRTFQHIYSFLIRKLPAFFNIAEHLADQFIKQPTGRLYTTKIKNQHAEGMLLLGDAAHSMLPFLGQGTNCAFEDCRLFNNMLLRRGNDWEAAVSTYAKNRIRDTDAIIEMSFSEYRELQPNYSFKQDMLISRLKMELEKRYPDHFKSHRFLLAFTHTPYEKIKKMLTHEQYLLNKLYHLWQVSKKINWSIADQYVDCHIRED